MRHFIAKMLIAILGLGCLLWVVCPTRRSSVQGQAAPVQVRVAPPSVQVAPGLMVDVAVEVVDVQELYGFDIILSFTPGVVEVVDADPNGTGVQVAQGTLLDAGFTVLNTADNAAGRLQFAMTQLNPSEAKNGTGSLIVVRLLGKQAGATSPLTLEKAQLAQRDGIEIPTGLVPGQVQVVASTGAQPTNTPLATQPQGTPLPTAGPTSAVSVSNTPAPPASTPEPAATPMLPGTSVAPTPEPVVGTTASVPSTAVPAGLTPGATSVALPPTASAGAPSATALPPAAVNPTALPPPAQPAETMVVQVQPQEAAPDSTLPPSKEQSDPARVFLVVSLAALVLAFLVGAVAVVLWLAQRRSVPK
jgi:hypothetical protein